ncbi:MAG: sugar nucleotide-binding protein, partial [Pseudomonadota bacterium]
EGAARIARLAASTGVQRMVHLSAIGADLSGTSIYAKTKGQGEVTVRKHMPEAVILRPSVVFGPEDQFFNRFAAMSRFNPVLPISGGETKFQPVYVDDVAQAAVAGVVGTAEAGIYELGGPDVESFRALMQRMLDVLDRSRVIFDMPSPLASLMAFGFDTLETVTGRLFKNTLLTRDQLKSLAFDNVVTGERGTFEDLGIAPRAMADILPLYVGVPAEQVDPRAIAQTAAQDG